MKSHTREELDEAIRTLEERIAKDKSEPEPTDNKILAASFLVGAIAGFWAAIFAGGIAFSIAALCGLTLLQTLGAAILFSMAASVVTLRCVGRWCVKQMKTDREKMRAEHQEGVER